MLNEQLQKLEAVLSLLGDVESQCEDVLAEVADSSDVAMVGAAFHCATHESATVIGLALSDIRTLIQRIQLRKKHKVFSSAEIDQIVKTAWSTTFVADLHERVSDHHAISLSDLSDLVKQIKSEWDALPKLNSHYGIPQP